MAARYAGWSYVDLLLASKSDEGHVRELLFNQLIKLNGIVLRITRLAVINYAHFGSRKDTFIFIEYRSKSCKSGMLIR